MRKAVVICPGRGSYTKTELGYFGRHHADKRGLIEEFDDRRRELGQERLLALDGASCYSPARHARGDNASALIYACTLCDFLTIEHAVEIVAVTGNSMGWYSALTCAGALSPRAGFEVVNTMGTLMQERLIGGQIIYPFMAEDWRDDPAHRAELMEIVARIDAAPDQRLALSIDYGGMLVLAGNEAGLAAFEAAVPNVQGRFPMRLVNHAAFHTPLQAPVAEAGRERLSQELFSSPSLPLVDGRGAIWWPQATDVVALREYTLGFQVTEPYNFTRAVQCAGREFAPDLFIVTGPGSSLGGAVAQSLIIEGWRGMKSKADFVALQRIAPLMISMGIDEQRSALAQAAGTEP